MSIDHGGRITLRQRETTEERVDYEGELVTAADTYRVVVRVAFQDGAVRFEAIGPEAPEWLLEIARTTLRTAWHGHRAGSPWPRRLTRWREQPDAN